MTIITAIIFGIVQGATEFLPVSSSGHLYLLSTMLGFEADLGFFIWLHVGTLIAVIITYRTTIWQLITHPSDKRVKLLLVASIPTFIIAAVWKLFMPDSFEKYLLPAGFFITFILLIVITKIKSKSLPIKSMSYFDALIVGAVQGLAVTPGLSRSGSTISALNFCGIKKEDAAEFSFLLSIPVILGGALVDIYEGFKEGSLHIGTNAIIGATNPIVDGMNNDIGIFVTIIGIAVSALTGIIAINIVEKFIKSDKFSYFAWYLPVPLLMSILLL